MPPKIKAKQSKNNDNVDMNTQSDLINQTPNPLNINPPVQLNIVSDNSNLNPNNQDNTSVTSSNNQHTTSIGNDQILRDIAIKLRIFDGDDYLRWSRECKRVLLLCKLNKFIESDYTDSTNSDDIILDLKCSAYLDEHISNRIKNELNKDKESAFGIWQALKEWYGHSDRLEIDKVFKELKFLRIENEDIEKYKETFLRILKIIKKFDVIIDDSFLVFCYFDGLGERGRRYKELYKDNQNPKPVDVCFELYGTM